ncbi:chalcone isomerase family protein [Alteromonas halophila]|uniref:Chalcone isomerase domain-containing protein n=1 Tax=Alteromonas halophila TaxID=516698 RepID=A0A918JRW9_9ALTE|nr:chalcone isomerase family protein [Alteromonas halophila]GGW96985.1 hypothetical protein GCM10007391_33860 [Alteromonas halophila]
MRKITLMLMLFSSLCAGAVPQAVDKHVTDARQVGQAMFTYYFWDVYEATLYAPGGKWSQDAPFALALTYQRDFDGQDIAERSVKEMRRQGLNDTQMLSEWGDTMTSLFPDVSEGDTLLGVATDTGSTLFFRDDTLLGEVSDKKFTYHFFNIWLGSDTFEPELREQLLNQAGN